MQKPEVDAEALRRAAARLGETVIDPAAWPQIMQDLSAAAGATGAMLLQSDVRTPDVPRTPSIEGAVQAYFRDDWHKRDLRAERGAPLLVRGAKVITDHDLFTQEEMGQASFYNECLLPNGLQWFAVVGFRSGPAHWGLAIQRKPQEGAFTAEEGRALAQLSDRLTEVATLSEAVGRAALSNVVNALHLIPQAAIAIDRSGRVLDANDTAQGLFDAEMQVVAGRLAITDAIAKHAYGSFLERLRLASDRLVLPTQPIVTRRRGRAPLVIKFLPVDGAARGPFLGARVLLLLTELGPRITSSADLLITAYGLSRAEARLAARLASGLSLETVAAELEIALATARTQIKAVFAKTGTHRQGELVALLARL